MRIHFSGEILFGLLVLEELGGSQWRLTWERAFDAL
jgi:hypothetical protein